MNILLTHLVNYTRIHMIRQTIFWDVFLTCVLPRYSSQRTQKQENEASCLHVRDIFLFLSTSGTRNRHPHKQS